MFTDLFFWLYVDLNYFVRKISHFSQNFTETVFFHQETNQRLKRLGF